MNAQVKEIRGLCQGEGILLVPYVDLEGSRTLTDSQVMAGFHGLVADGTLDTVFPTGGIAEPDDFLAFAKLPGVLLTFIYVDDQLAGFAWLSDLRHRWALGNFALFKAIWGARTFGVGRLVLNLWFSMAHQGEVVFDTIGGVTPSTNRLAVHYIEKLGFTVLGKIPIGASGVTISYLTRDKFYGRR